MLNGSIIGANSASQLNQDLCNVYLCFPFRIIAMAGDMSNLGNRLKQMADEEIARITSNICTEMGEKIAQLMQELETVRETMAKSHRENDVLRQENVLLQLELQGKEQVITVMQAERERGGRWDWVFDEQLETSSRQAPAANNPPRQERE